MLSKPVGSAAAPRGSRALLVLVKRSTARLSRCDAGAHLNRDARTSSSEHLLALAPADASAVGVALATVVAIAPPTY